MADLSIVSIEARVKALETNVQGWFSRNWAHIVTWAGIAYGVLKHL